jgi:hypothetical protein
MDQSIIDRAVNIATQKALNGHPVGRIIWIPPTSATHNPGGNFVIYECSPLSAGYTPPWDK